MTKKTLPKIEVRTVSNGYVLTFDDMKAPGGYLYWSPDKLLEGIMCHIGLDMTEQLNPEMMQDFIVAAVTYKDNKACIDEIDRLNGEIKSLQLNRSVLVNKIITERNRVLSLVNGIADLAKKYKNLKDLSQHLNGLIKNFTKFKPYTIGDFTFKGQKVEAVKDEDVEEDDDA